VDINVQPRHPTLHYSARTPTQQHADTRNSSAHARKQAHAGDIVPKRIVTTSSPGPVHRGLLSTRSEVTFPLNHDRGGPLALSPLLAAPEGNNETMLQCFTLSLCTATAFLTKKLNRMKPLQKPTRAAPSGVAERSVVYIGQMETFEGSYSKR
jgi:hypothetical protein